MSLSNNENLISNNNTPIDRISVIALIYLGLPTLLFIVGWLKPVFSLILLIVFSTGFLTATKEKIKSLKTWQPLRNIKTTAIIIIFSVAWTYFGGAGHFVYANFDWLTRDAVLRDLTVTEWPPAYGSDGIFNYILRAPVGYFLPAAMLGKWVGLAWADKLLWLWTAIGVSIFMLLLPIRQTTIFRVTTTVLTVVFFSGLDVIGWAIVSGDIPNAGQHLEWWAHSFQYSANSTQLFWVPNHALPAWIGSALFYRHWRHSSFPAFAPMLLAAIPLWSPFAALGLAPFYLLLASRLINQRDTRILKICTLLPALGILMVCVRYLTLDIGTVPARTALTSGSDIFSFIFQYSIFVLLEFGIIAALIYNKEQKLIFTTAAITLLLLPFFRMGPGNDLVMRSSIPSLAMLCILTLEYINSINFKKWKSASLILFLCIGAVTPAQEFIRAITEPSWAPRLNANLIEASGGQLPPHYGARLNQPGLNWLMNAPSNVPGVSIAP